VPGRQPTTHTLTAMQSLHAPREGLLAAPPVSLCQRSTTIQTPKLLSFLLFFLPCKNRPPPKPGREGGRKREREGCFQTEGIPPIEFQSGHHHHAPQVDQQTDDQLNDQLNRQTNKQMKKQTDARPPVRTCRGLSRRSDRNKINELTGFIKECMQVSHQTLRCSKAQTTSQRLPSFLPSFWGNVLLLSLTPFFWTFIAIHQSRQKASLF